MIVALAVVVALPAVAPAAFAPAIEDQARLSRSSLPPTNAVVVLEAPRVGFTDEEAAALYGWVFAGGNLLLVDDTVVGADLTARMGAPVQMLSSRLYTPIFDGTPERIPLFDLGVIPGLPSGLTTSRPALVVGGHDAVLMPTLTWADRNDNGRPDLGETLAQGSILSVVDIGEGILVILSDPSLYERADFQGALDAYLTEEGARPLVRDRSHEPRVDPFYANALLTASPPRLAAILLAGAAALLLLFALARPSWTRIAPPRRPAPRDDLVLQAISELE